MRDSDLLLPDLHTAPRVSQGNAQAICRHNSSLTCRVSLGTRVFGCRSRIVSVTDAMLSRLTDLLKSPMAR
jgi:hypothetical protein